MDARRFRTGNGAAWLDLLQSLHGRYRETLSDDLQVPADLDAWLAELATKPRRAATDADLQHARELREALFGLGEAVVRGTAPRPADVTAVERALADDRPLHLRVSDGQLRASAPADAAEALARLAREAVTTITGSDREHLHACGDDTCSGIFLDRTGRRRWCSDESCGNRLRVRAYREARRAERRRPGRSAAARPATDDGA